MGGISVSGDVEAHAGVSGEAEVDVELEFHLDEGTLWAVKIINDSRNVDSEGVLSALEMDISPAREVGSEWLHATYRFREPVYEKYLSFGVLREVSVENFAKAYPTALTFDQSTGTLRFDGEIKRRLWEYFLDRAGLDCGMYGNGFDPMPGCSLSYRELSEGVYTPQRKDPWGAYEEFEQKLGLRAAVRDLFHKRGNPDQGTLKVRCSIGRQRHGTGTHARDP